MLNIISPLTLSKIITGPMKVLSNTIKGLDLIEYPYVINKCLNSTKRVWIQNGRVALPFLYKTKAKVVIGPNTAVLPSDLSAYSYTQALYLHPRPALIPHIATGH